MRENFKDVKPLKYWVQNVLPQAYDDSLSYQDLLYKVVSLLNQVIENNNEMPQYVSELIQDYISSGAIGEVVQNVLSEYMLNVKNPPLGLKVAVGDGSEDDTEAIQGCIDFASANGGKAIYFPSGRYLSNSLILKDNVSMIGFDRSNTHIVLTGGATQPLISGTCSNNTLSRITLDGNMSIQVHDINVIDLKGGKYVFSELEITDGYTLMKLYVNDFVQGNNILFGEGVIDSLTVRGDGIVNFNNIIFKELSILRGKNIINNSVENAIFENIYSTCNVHTPINNVGNKSVFIGKLVNNVENITDTSIDSYYNFYDKGSTIINELSKINYLQTDEPLQTNENTIWYAINSKINTDQEYVFVPIV